jgi:putative two-component system response regulator
MTPTDTASRQILVVDDEPGITFLLGHLLESQGYQVKTASDGRTALDLVARQPPDLIVLDLDMPGLSGYEVCRRLKSDAPTRLIPIIILTGQGSFVAKMQVWELGADDFLTKPYESAEVLARCRSLLRIKGLVDELDSAQAVVFAFARAVEAKNPYARGHTQRVTGYALALADQVSLPDPEREVLRQGAALHDVGKIRIPDAILNKPGPLTPEEYEVVKQHPGEGVRIVEPLRSIKATVPLIRWHHERLDGRGYPDGLSGAAIPQLVRMLSVVDVYDALRSERPYRAGIPHRDCLDMLRANAAGGGLDAELVRCFCAAIA